MRNPLNNPIKFTVDMNERLRYNFLIFTTNKKAKSLSSRVM